jgi:hypothetical protein
MKRIALWLALLSFSALLLGCAAKPLYYWGSYEKSLYAYKKEPTEDTRKDHIETLQDIIKVSQEEGTRVPPGVYAEYGYIMLQTGKKAEAMKYFDLEQKTYPESALMVNRLNSLAQPPPPVQPPPAVQMQVPPTVAPVTAPESVPPPAAVPAGAPSQGVENKESAVEKGVPK